MRALARLPTHPQSGKPMATLTGVASGSLSTLRRTALVSLLLGKLSHVQQAI